MNHQHKTCQHCRQRFDKPPHTSQKRWCARKFCSNACSLLALADQDQINARLEKKGKEPLQPRVIEVTIDADAPLFRFLSGKHRQELNEWDD